MCEQLELDLNLPNNTERENGMPDNTTLNDDANRASEIATDVLNHIIKATLEGDDPKAQYTIDAKYAKSSGKGDTEDISIHVMGYKNGVGRSHGFDLHLSPQSYS